MAIQRQERLRINNILRIGPARQNQEYRFNPDYNLLRIEPARHYQESYYHFNPDPDDELGQI